MLMMGPLVSDGEEDAADEAAETELDGAEDMDMPVDSAFTVTPESYIFVLDVYVGYGMLVVSDAMVLVAHAELEDAWADELGLEIVVHSAVEEDAVELEWTVTASCRILENTLEACSGVSVVVLSTVACAVVTVTVCCACVLVEVYRLLDAYELSVVYELAEVYEL